MQTQDANRRRWRAATDAEAAMQRFSIQQVIPILRIFDVARAREFYLGFLGATVDWDHRFDEKAPLYMQIELGGAKLHLSEHHGDGCPGSIVFLRVKGLTDYHAKIMARDYGHLRPGIERTDRNSLSVEVIDPFGNRLRFDESLETS